MPKNRDFQRGVTRENDPRRALRVRGLVEYAGARAQRCFEICAVHVRNQCIDLPVRRPAQLGVALPKVCGASHAVKG